MTYFMNIGPDKLKHANMSFRAISSDILCKTMHALSLLSLIVERNGGIKLDEVAAYHTI
jgi:hypothetical protein